MKKVIAIIAIASALILTGCSQVGVAASVGSTKITQATIQKSIDTVLSERAKIKDTSQMQLETGEALNRSQLRFHVIEIILRAAAADGKITVTKAEIDQRRAKIITQVGGKEKLPEGLAGAGIASTDLDLYIQLILLSDKLSASAVAAGVDTKDVGAAIQEVVIKKANELKVKINPRYGKWDSKLGDIVAVDSASSAASPSATP